jgi:hypothetical protein
MIAAMAARGQGDGRRLSMTKESRIAQVQASIEDELGKLRHFADLPAAEIEALARRITRAVEHYLEPVASTRSEAA